MSSKPPLIKRFAGGGVQAAIRLIMSSGKAGYPLKSPSIR